MEQLDIDALWKEMENVPFGNSAFQNEHFTDGQEAPERRYRHAMLQLHKKVHALQACEFRRQRIDIDIEELDEKTRDAEGFELRRLEIDRAEKEWQLKAEEQLIVDAMVEVETYRAMLEDLPKPTREQFEAAELGYWRKRLIGEAKLQYAAGKIDAGWLIALDKIDVAVHREPLEGDGEQIRFLDKKLLIPTGGNHK